MDARLKQDLRDLGQILETIKSQGLAYLSTLSDRATSAGRQETGTGVLPDSGVGAMQALEEFNRRFEHLIVASSGPRYLGFVTGGSTPAAIAADWLVSVYDQNTQGVQGQGDVSALLEIETIGLLLELLRLPNDFAGGFVSGATMANFTCLGVARQWVGKQMGIDFARQGVSGKIRVLSATPHSSALKSLSMLGIGSNTIEKVKILDGNREAMDIEDLERVIASSPSEPFILVSSAGTVNTVDFDDFEAISELKKKYGFWWHIDAAFGAFASASEKYRHLVKGWETADSIAVDCHKWLNVPYESAVFLVRNEHRLLQTETYQNSNAPYISLDQAFTYLNFLPENSRRFKALPAWFTLKAYGREGYASIVGNSVEMANYLGQSIEGSESFELLAPVRLNTVCFSLKGLENQDKVADFLTRLNATQKVFMTPTVYAGRKGIRASFVNWRTTKADVDLVFAQMQGLV